MQTEAKTEHTRKAWWDQLVNLWCQRTAEEFAVHYKRYNCSNECAAQMGNIEPAPGIKQPDRFSWSQLS